MLSFIHFVKGCKSPKMDKTNAYAPGHGNGIREFKPKVEKLDPDPGNNRNCRLCLAGIIESDFTVLDGIIKDMLEIILPELVRSHFR